MAQVNPTVGDFAHNSRLILDAWREGRAAGVDLVVLPELVLTGYPPEDLITRPAFVAAAGEGGPVAGWQH